MTSRLAERAGLLARDRAAARAGRRAAARGRAALLHAGVRDPRVPAARGDRRPARRSRSARSCVLLAPVAYLNYRVRRAPAAVRDASCPTRSRCSRARCAPASRSCRASRRSRRRSADPMRKELQRVFTEVRLGRPVEDALGDAADRMDSNDLRWTVMAIRIQREVGGNLAVLLDTVSDTMVKRERVRRELRALTAEGRLSAIVLSLVSPVLAARDLAHPAVVPEAALPRLPRHRRPDRRGRAVDRRLVLAAPHRRHRGLR